MQSLTNYGYLDEYQILAQLGEGSQGEVVVAVKDNKKYALKMFKGTDFAYENWKHQVEILKKFEHRNIVKLVDVREKAKYKTSDGRIQERFVIVLEHVEGGELFSYLVVGRFSEGAARAYFRILLDAISYMHSQGVAHRDLKPQNILLDQNFDLRIIDFGFSAYLKRGALHTRCGTEAYMAPEIYQKNYEGKSVDCFAAGIILFMLYTGVPPFLRANQLTDKYYQALYEKKYNKFWQGHTTRLPQGHLTDDFKNLIERMLAHNPQQRIALNQVYEHPWMAGEILMLNQVYQEFTLRKKKFDELRAAELEFQRKKREEMKKFQGKNRSAQDSDELSPYFSKVDTKYSELKVSTDVYPLDLVISQSPALFAAILQYNFQHRQRNLVIDPQEIQRFTVTYNNNKQEIAVTVSNLCVQNLESRSATVSIGLFAEKDGKMRLRFVHETGEDLLAWKLVDVIRNGFYYEM